MNERLEQIRERAEKATPGLWNLDGYEHGPYFMLEAITSDEGQVAWSDGSQDHMVLNGDDATFLHHAHQDVTVLLAYIDNITKGVVQ